MTHLASAAIDTLELARAQLRDAADLLSAVAGRAASLPDETNWQTAAATRFHASAQAWRDEVAALTHLADVVHDDVTRVRDRILFESGAPL